MPRLLLTPLLLTLSRARAPHCATAPLVQVRDAGKELAVEMYSWAGGPIEASLKTIKPVQLKELKEHWESVEVGSKQPTRLTAKAAAAQAAAGGGSACPAGGTAANNEDSADGDAEDVEETEVDSYEMVRGYLAIGLSGYRAIGLSGYRASFFTIFGCTATFPHTKRVVFFLNAIDTERSHADLTLLRPFSTPRPPQSK